MHVAANKVFLLDDSENPDQLELDSVITLDYNQINPDSPSSNSEQPMRIASIQFNAVKFIGKLKFFLISSSLYLFTPVIYYATLYDII